MIDVVWLLITLETGKFDGSIQGEIYQTQQECLDGAFSEQMTYELEPGLFGGKVVPKGVKSVEAQDWVCIPMVGTPHPVINKN